MKKQLLAFLFICNAFIQVSAQDNPYAIIRKPHNSDGYLLMSNDLSLSNNYIVRIFESKINTAGNDTLISKEKYTLLGKSYLKFPQSYLDKSGAHSYFYQISGYNNEGTLMYSSDFIPCTSGEIAWMETDRYTCNGSDYAYSIAQNHNNYPSRYKYSLEDAYQYYSSADETALPYYEYMYLSDLSAIVYNTNTNLVNYAQYHGFGYNPETNSLLPGSQSVIGNPTYIFAYEDSVAPFVVYNNQNEQLSTNSESIVGVRKGKGYWCCGPPIITSTIGANWSSFFDNSVVSLLGMFNDSANIDIEIDGNRIYPDLTCDGELSSGNLVSDPTNDLPDLDCFDLLDAEGDPLDVFHNYLNCIGAGHLSAYSFEFSDWSDGVGISIGDLDLNEMIDSKGNYRPNSIYLPSGLYMISVKESGLIKHLKFKEFTDSINLSIPISALVDINLFANPIVNGSYKISFNSTINTKLTYSVYDLNSNLISSETIYLNSLSSGITEFALPALHQNKDLIHFFTFNDGSTYQIHSGH